MKHVSADQVKKDVPNSNAQHRRKVATGFLVAGVLATGLILKSPDILQYLGWIQSPAEQSPITYKKGGSIVKSGDAVFSWNNADSSTSLRVVEIDKQGITLRFESEIYMSEHASETFRVNYGEPRTMGESALTLMVKAEKGPREETAIVTVSAKK